MRVTAGMRGCSATALETMVVTFGTSPATADIMKLVEPWQWMIALILVRTGFAHTVSTALRVVVQRGLVERPGIGRKIDAGTPVLQPHVVAVTEQGSDDGGVGRGTEQVRPHARPVHQQHRARVGRLPPAQVKQIERHAVAGNERHDKLFDLARIGRG